MKSFPSNSAPEHNDTFDKQGGDSTSNEFYHLTSEEKDQALAIATDTTLGQVIVGDGLTVDENGVVTVDEPATDHNYLNGLQGGDSTSSEYFHLTEEKYNVVENTSGINTGDQESSDFDHNQLQNTHNLTSDIDHDSITNTHNLTSDIDHNSINGLQGGDSTSSEYFHLTEAERDKALREFSEGCWTSPTLVDNHDGTITIGDDGEYNLNCETDGSGNVVTYNIPGGTFDASNQVPHYIIANYNNGSPIIECIESYSTINGLTKIPILIIFYNTAVAPPSFDIIDWGEQAKAVDTNTKLRFLFAGQNGVEDNGFLLTVFDTKKIRISSAVRWYGLARLSYEEFETGKAGHYLREWVKDGAGNWVPSIVTEYDNQSYQNPAGGKTALTHNYGVLWVYRKLSTTDPLGVVAGYIFGTTSYSKLSDAQAATPPDYANIPPIFVSFGIFVGRIIIDKRQDLPIEVDSAFHYDFGASIPNHNETLNKQGGDVVLDEFYHLTSAEHTVVQNTSGINTGDQVASDFNHNEIEGLQGGDATSNEYYHLDETNYNNLISGSLTISLEDNVNITGNISKYAEFYDSLSSNIIRTLPDASLNVGKLYFFKKTDSSLFTVAITPRGGNFIDGESDSYLLETEDEFVQLLARNSTSWEVVSE